MRWGKLRKKVWVKKNQEGYRHSPLTRALIVLFWALLIALWVLILVALFGSSSPQLFHAPWPY